MHTAAICFKTLKAISAFASTEEARYYLNGVLLTLDANGAEYVATDGHRLAARRIDLPEGVDRNTFIGSFIIPTKVCKSFKWNVRMAPDGTAHDAGNGELKLVGPDSTASVFKPVDGTFPDWRRVVPQSATGVFSIGINGAYLNSVDTLAKELDLGAKNCHWNSDGPIPFTFSRDTDTIAIVMPVNQPKDLAWIVPAWVSLTPVTDNLASSVAA